MESGKDYRDRLVSLLARGPKRPSDLGWRSRWRVLGRTFRELLLDDLTDRAALLTYYSLLSIFPGLLVLMAIVGLAGGPTMRSVTEGIKSLAFGPIHQIIAQGITNVQDNKQEAGVMAIVGLVIAFYSATGYVGAFMRAANAIYDVPEGRPLWKTVPLRLAITAFTGVFLAVSALAVVFTGRLATAVGGSLGIAQEKIRLFDVIKWPLLVVAFGLLLAILYWAAPNVRQGGFAWITPGSVLATLVWLVISGGFGVYINYFDSYDRTYGALGGVIIFIVWMWLTNVSVLLGAEFDAELARERALVAGLEPSAEPYLPLRDVPKDEN